MTDGNYSATYAYHANSRLVSTVTSKHLTTTRLTVGRAYDKLNRLQSIQNTPAGANQLADLSAYAYNDANQRVRRTLADGSYWVYAYDALGQVTSGKRYWNDGTPVAGQQFEYAFDDIGNRTGANGAKMGGDENGANLRPATYTPNLLNQYASRGVPGYVEILGLATAGSPVTVNGSGSGVYRRGEYFRRELPVANGSAPVWQAVSVSAGGTATTGNALVPATPQSFTYDLDGNLTGDGLWNYTWDAENRLLKMESPTANPAASRRRLEFKYDANGRRIWKKVTKLSDSSVLSETRFLYDGWNLLAELSGASGTTTVRTYLWGTDLSGSLQGAGGVGGLLAVRPTTTGISHFAGYDGNGNLTLLVDGSTGLASAAYEYGPFGEALRVTGPMGSANPFAFSTKFADRETGLLYYGYRYYSPSLGRWINRDRIGENGGLPLYGFVANAPSVGVDPFGNALYAFDGTNNDRNRDTPNSEETNVAILWSIYLGDRFYMPGVGTNEDSTWYNNLGLVGGYGGNARIEDMLASLQSQIEKGDMDVDVIGFSRGAATAREFVNRIYDNYPCLRVRFLGLFDTVGSFGLGGNDVNIGYRMKIPDIVDTVIHITAQDERRYFFPLSSILTGPPGSGRRYPVHGEDWWEFSLPGAHSDIGGGYSDRRQFANLSLKLMHFQALGRGVPFGPIPTQYQDTNTNGLSPHDSRWFNDIIGDWLNRQNGLPLRPRDVYYYP